jgi:hypothetical protein
VIWLAWRQVRTQVFLVVGVLLAIGVVLATTGPHLVHIYDTVIKPCEAKPNCGNVGTFSNTDRFLQSVSLLLLIAPALVGMFWGAPLVAREFENNSHRLIWTQSVSRMRWLAAKLGIGALVTVVTVGLLSLMTTWWFSPIDAFSNNSLTPSTFDRRDVVPVAYALFAFALGATAGLLLRRTLPAMVVTLFGFIGLRYVVEDYLRLHYMTPLKISAPFNPLNPGLTVGRPGGLQSSDQVVSQETVTGTGRVLSQNGNIGPTSGEVSVSNSGTVTLRGVGPCQGHVNNSLKATGRVSQSVQQSGSGTTHVHARSGGAIEQLNQIVSACSHKYGLRDIVTYQPLSRYWPFQMYESAIFIVAGLVLAGFSLWWLRRRMA